MFPVIVNVVAEGFVNKPARCNRVCLALFLQLKCATHNNTVGTPRKGR